MRYSVYFLSTNDKTINFSPRQVNLGINSKRINIEFLKKIPLDKIISVETEHTASEKAFSVAKALGGAILIGPIGLVGGALGGKKVVSVMTVEYMNENNEPVKAMFEGKMTALIQKNYDKLTYSPRSSANTSRFADNGFVKFLYWGSTLGIWMYVYRIYFRFLKRIFGNKKQQ